MYLLKNTDLNSTFVPDSYVYVQNPTEPSVLVLIKYLTPQQSVGQKFTEVTIPVCPVKTAIGIPDCRFQTLNILSIDPAANKVFSELIAISVISEEAPLKVAIKRPVQADQSFINKSSAPYKNIIISHY